MNQSNSQNYLCGVNSIVIMITLRISISILVQGFKKINFKEQQMKCFHHNRLACFDVDCIVTHHLSEVKCVQ